MFRCRSEAFSRTGQVLYRVRRFGLNRFRTPVSVSDYRLILFSFTAYLRWNRSSSTSSPRPGASATVYEPFSKMNSSGRYTFGAARSSSIVRNVSEAAP